VRPARRVCEVWASIFDQPDFSGTRTLAGFFLREFNSLAFAQQLEYRATHRAAVEEVFDSRFVANESEALIDQKASDRPGRHTLSSDERTPKIILGAFAQAMARE
jgi:hypothetical protein